MFIFSCKVHIEMSPRKVMDSKCKWQLTLCHVWEHLVDDILNHPVKSAGEVTFHCLQLETRPCNKTRFSTLAHKLTRKHISTTNSSF